MNPIMIPITLTIGTIFLFGLTVYRVWRHNKAITTNLISNNKILGIARQSGISGQMIQIAMNGTFQTTQNTQQQSIKPNTDLYY